MPLQTPYRLVLASGSPRRRQLLADMGFDFTVRLKPIDESFPDALPKAEVAEYLARQKAEAARPDLQPGELLVTADTTVRLGETLLEKAADPAEAVRMLSALSGKTHEVRTGVCLTTLEKTVAFSEAAEVTLRELTAEEIHYYVETFAPFDKAGAYAIQEWIGMVGVTQIKGTYFNVMGLPTARLYLELGRF